MGKNTSNPVILDNLLSINMKRLVQLGFIQNGLIVSGFLSWLEGNQLIGRMKITCDLTDKTNEENYISFNYILNQNERIEYRIPIVRIPTNLGSSYRYYFKCNFSGKRCCVLYFQNMYFVHRNEIKNSFYASQIKSKNEKVISNFFKEIDFKKKDTKRKLRTLYKGKPTKKYLKFLKMKEKQSKVEVKEVLRILKLHIRDVV